MASPNEFIDDDGPAWDSAADELLTGSDPAWNSPERPANQNIEGNDLPDGRPLPTGYLEYRENIQEEGGAFYQIGADLFVVNGWDPQKKIPKSTWFHLQRSTFGDSDVVVCQCLLSHPSEYCVHQWFLLDYGDELFPSDESFAEGAEVVLFSRVELEEGVFVNYFSSPSPNSRSLNGRVIVVYTGDDTGAGQWLCGKDAATPGCWHVSKCRDWLQKLVQVDPTATDEQAGDGVISTKLDNEIIFIVSRVRRSVLDNKSVSYLPISPPPWASLDSDPDFYDRAPPLESPPDALCLEESSSCCCSEPRRLYSRARPIIRAECIVYGLFRAWKTTIELQACSNPRCRHRHIGPDGRERGIFNYNNRKLFAHDLLDEYTSAYTSSEIPFSAWVTVVSRRYKSHSEPTEYPFVTAEVFRAAWFSYVKLQHLEGSMMCPQCGSSPENTIWDGVTLAFNRKHLLPSLEPPTTSQPDAIDRWTTRYVPSQQLVTNKKVRRLVRLVIVGGPLTMSRLNATVTPRGELEDPGDDENEDEDEDEEENEEDEGSGGSRKKSRAERAANKARLEMLERLQAIPAAVEGLSKSSPLWESFQGKVAPEVYRRFFFQITAEESVLQMTTKPALQALQAFVTQPNHRNASALVEIPVIHELLSHEKVSTGLFPPITIAVCRWVLERGGMVLDSLIKGPEPPKIAEDGLLLRHAKIRERPRYPKLKHDVNNDVGGKRGAKCSKFYSQYGERRLTVELSLITRWEKAPKRVIYDFACALGPYCMTREPTFFANTQFLIDDFHSVGHTKSPAGLYQFERWRMWKQWIGSYSQKGVEKASEMLVNVDTKLLESMVGGVITPRRGERADGAITPPVGLAVGSRGSKSELAVCSHRGALNQIGGVITPRRGERADGVVAPPVGLAVGSRRGSKSERADGAITPPVGLAVGSRRGSKSEFGERADGAITPPVGLAVGSRRGSKSELAVCSHRGALNQAAGVIAPRRGERADGVVAPPVGLAVGSRRGSKSELASVRAMKQDETVHRRFAQRNAARSQSAVVIQPPGGGAPVLNTSEYREKGLGSERATRRFAVRASEPTILTTTTTVIHGTRAPCPFRQGFFELNHGTRTVTAKGARASEQPGGTVVHDTRVPFKDSERATRREAARASEPTSDDHNQSERTMYLYYSPGACDAPRSAHASEQLCHGHGGSPISVAAMKSLHCCNGLGCLQLKVTHRYAEHTYYQTGGGKSRHPDDIPGLARTRAGRLPGKTLVGDSFNSSN
ncbi:hypothetical protein C8R45DRAFT_939868 [Mycena sanguinolenta]|nr:hypothetical protein C8R45DRAFT_939868 [Mycena sanguinolenta]